MPTRSEIEQLGPWSAIILPDAGINRRHAKRTVPLEVLNLGVSRTGTLSMRQAFDILGYQNPYHFASIFENVSDADMWNEALQAKYHNPSRGQDFAWKQFFDAVLGHCGAIGDAPIIVFWKELVACYPDAKIVLVQRPVEKWLPSCRAVVTGTLDPVSNVIRYLDPGWMGKIIKLGRGWVEVFFGSTDLEIAMKNAEERYFNHYDAIRKAAPKDKVLDYQLGSGWEPLCKFLGKPVPEMPFPHANEAKVLEIAFGALQKRALKNVLRNFAVGGLTMIFGYVCFSYLNP